MDFSSLTANYTTLMWSTRNFPVVMNEPCPVSKTKISSLLFSTLLVLETFLTGVKFICVIDEKELLSVFSEKDVRN